MLNQKIEITRDWQCERLPYISLKKTKVNQFCKKTHHIDDIGDVDERRVQLERLRRVQHHGQEAEERQRSADVISHIS